MRYFRVALLALGAGGLMAMSAGEPAKRHPVAVELFTSQACVACPPADAVMVRLASDPAVVAFTRPVTLWDSPEWKDTLARPANSALQEAYRAREFDGGSAYTPQSVIQGRTGINGRNEGEIRKAVAKAAVLPEPGLEIMPTADGGRAVRIAGKAAEPATVSVVALRRMTLVVVRRGGGAKQARYPNVVVSEQRIGLWKGGSATLAVPAAALKQARADRYALVVRSGKGGPILAARYL